MKNMYFNIKEFIEDILPSNKKSDKPKLAILCAIFSGFDGVGRVAEIQSKELSVNYDVSVIALEGNIIPPKDVDLYIIGSPDNLLLSRVYRLLFPLNLIKFWRYMKLLSSFDVIIAHQYPLTLLAYVIKIINSSIYIYWHHHIPTEFKEFYQKFYMKIIVYLDEKSWIIKKADYICSVSEFSKKILLERGKIDSVVVYNTVDDRFNNNLNGGIIREKHHIGKRPLLLFVGRIHPAKNIHTLIEVFKIAKEYISDLKLIIVGKTVFDKYFDNIKKMSDESVIFAGFVPDDELPYYYAACDVYVTCSLSEGFNLPLVEAQTCGKHVVAFDIGPHREVIKKGYLIEKDNVEDFAVKIIEILNNKVYK